MSKEIIELDADTYDTLEFTSLAFGGIGTDDYWTGWTGESPEAPVCFIGHIAFASNRQPCAVEHDMQHRVDVQKSDVAVQCINVRRGRPANSRVSWKEYTRELNIVRKSS